MPDQPRDAREAPPWRPEAGPEPIDGAWRQAAVRARHDYPPGQHPNAGRVAYQVDVRLPARPGYPDDPGALETYSRTYWWDPGVMRAVKA